MKSLFMYEVKKATRNKSVVVLIILLCVCNLAFALLSDAAEPKTDDYTDTYQRTLDDIIYNSKINYTFSENKSSAEAQYQIEIDRHYSEIINAVVDTKVSGYDVLISSPIPYISALVTAVYVFSMSSYTDVTENLVFQTFIIKRRKLACIKLLFALVSAISFNLLSLLFAGVGVLIRFGYNGAFAHIGAIPKYIRCPYDINVITTLCLRFAVSILITFILSLLAGVIIFATKKFIYTLLTLAIVLGCDILLASISTDILSFYHNFNITSAMTDSWLLRYSGILFGVFISKIVLLPLMSLCLAIFGTATFYHTIIKFQCIKAEKKKRANISYHNHRHNRLAYESKRLCNVRTLTVIVILLMLKCVFLFYHTNTPDSAWERVYKNHMSLIETMTYDEQILFTINETISANEIINYGAAAREMLENDEITLEEYIDAVERVGAAELRRDVLKEIRNQLDAISDLQEEGLEATLVYATGWKKLFSQGPDYILLVTLMLVIVPYMTGENDTGYRSVLNASFYGKYNAHKKYKNVKYVSAIAVSIAIILLFMVTDLSFVHLRIGLPAWDKYIRGAGISAPLTSMTFIGAISEYFLLATIGATLLIIVSNILSEMKLKLVPTILITSIYIVILTVTSYFFHIYASANITSFFSYETIYVDPMDVITQTAVCFCVVSTLSIAVRNYTAVDR